jgi:hypothetical protein
MSIEELIIIISYYILNINKLFFFLSIALDSYILLVRYSGFLLKVFTLIFFISLIYKIQKLYVANISVQYTYCRLSSFIIIK